MMPPNVISSGIRSHAAPAPAGLRVLVVDDDPKIVEIVCLLLRRVGFAVEATTDSAEALALLTRETGAFDALVSDHDMPGMSGSELIDRARLAGFRGKVVLHSGGMNGADAAEKIRRADAVVEKPFGASTLVPVLLRLAA
jgi:CheY-like chemotaxis protein